MKKNIMMVIVGMMMAITISPLMGQEVEEEFSLFNQRAVTRDIEVTVLGGASRYQEATLPACAVEASWQAMDHFRLGGIVSAAKNATTPIPMMGADLEAVFRLGYNLGFHADLTLMGGVGAINHTYTGENEWFVTKSHRITLHPEIGGSLGVGYNLDHVGFSLRVAYRHMLGDAPVKGSNDEITITSDQVSANPLTIMAGVTYRTHQENVYRSGDHTWRPGAYVAIPLKGNGLKVGAEIVRNDLVELNWMLVWGLDYGQTLDASGKTSFGGKFGFQHLFKGHTSVLIPELNVHLGMSEAKIKIEAYGEGAQGAELTQISSSQNVALEMGAEARLSIRMAGVTLFGGLDLSHKIPFKMEGGGDIESYSTEVVDATIPSVKLGVSITL